MTSSLFPKHPLVVTLKRNLMLHQEIKLKNTQWKSSSTKTAVSVKFQDLTVIQVWNVFLAAAYWHNWRVRSFVRFYRGTFYDRAFYCLNFYLSSVKTDSKDCHEWNIKLLTYRSTDILFSKFSALYLVHAWWEKKYCIKTCSTSFPETRRRGPWERGWRPD